MKWRPDNWRPIECSLPQTFDEKCLTATAKQYYELGADAMLEGLKKDPMVLLHISHKGDAEIQRLIEDYYKE